MSLQKIIDIVFYVCLALYFFASLLTLIPPPYLEYILGGCAALKAIFYFTT